MMKELGEDEFKTFIAVEENKERPLEIQKLMQAVLKGGFNLRPDDFWKMPLNTVLEMLGLFILPEKKSMSRKVLIDKERLINQQYGIC